MTSPAPRAVLAVAAVASAGALLAACGSSSGSSAGATATSTVTVTATPTPTAVGSTSKPPSGPPACDTSALAVKLGEGNGAAGSTYVPIVFTNKSSSACSMFGYPGVSFVTGPGGSQVGSAAARSSTQSPVSVTLAPGAVAHATLQIVDAENFPLSACKITSVHTLKVFPPANTVAAYLTLATKTCASTAPAVQVLDVQTVASGTGA
jgi:hypothetical protein